MFSDKRRANLMKKKRIIMIPLAVACVISLLSGCKGSSDRTSD